MILIYNKIKFKKKNQTNIIRLCCQHRVVNVIYSSYQNITWKLYELMSKHCFRSKAKHKHFNSHFKEHDTWEKLINWVPTFSLINFFYTLQFHSKESGYIPYKQIQWTTSRLPLLKQKHSLELQGLLTQRKTTGEKHFNHFFEFLFF